MVFGYNVKEEAQEIKTELTSSRNDILDDTTLQTMEFSYKDYPLPTERIRVRYVVGYYWH